MSKIKLGFSSCIFPQDPHRAIFKNKALFYLEEKMSRWFLDEGALAFLIPPHDNQDVVREHLNEMDGLVMTGGTDVAPESYGEKPLRPEWCGDPVRDRYEISLLQMALAMGKPVFGICRGIQVINVALGGTLYQDINAQVKDTQVHRNWDIYEDLIHPIKIKKGSRLAEI